MGALFFLIHIFLTPRAFSSLNYGRVALGLCIYMLSADAHAQFGVGC